MYYSHFIAEKLLLREVKYFLQGNIPINGIAWIRTQFFQFQILVYSSTNFATPSFTIPKFELDEDSPKCPMKTFLPHNMCVFEVGDWVGFHLGCLMVF